MFGAGLPNVGATATLLGVAAFQNQAAQVTRALAGINTATENLGRVSVTSWNSVGNAAANGSASFIRATGAIGVAVAAVTAGIKGLSVTAAFQENLKNIEIVAEGTSKQLGSLTSDTFKLAKQFGAMPNEIAQANIELVKGGLAFDELEAGATRATLALVRATVGEINFADAAKLMIQGRAQYGLTGQEFDRVSNSIVGAANKSTASVGELNAAFRQAIIPKEVGATIEEVSAALAILASNGLRGERGGTALRNMFLTLLDPSKEALEIMKRYNISIFDAQGNSLGFTNIISRMAEAFKETGDAASNAQKAFDQASLFGARQGSAASIFARVGTESYKALTNELRTNVDAARQAERQMDVLNKQLDRVKATVVVLVTQALSPLANALTPVTRQVADLLGLLNGTNFGEGLIAFANNPAVTALGEVFNTVSAGVYALSQSFKALDVPTITTAIGTNLVQALDYLNSALVVTFAVFATVREQILSITLVSQALSTGLQAIPFVLVAAAVLVVVSALLPLIVAFGKIILIITAVGAAIMAVQAVMANWQTIIAAVSSTLEGVLNAVLLKLEAVTLDLSVSIAGVIDSVVSMAEAFADTGLGQIVILLVQIAIEAAKVAAILAVTLVAGLIALAAVILDVALRGWSEFIEGLLDGGGQAIQMFADLGAFIAPLIANIIGVIESFQEAFVTVVINVLKAILGLMQGLSGAANSWLQSWNGMGGIASATLKFVADRISAFLNFLRGLPLIGGFIEGAIGVFEGAKNAVGGFVDEIGARAEGLVDTVGGAFSQAQESIKGLTDGIGDALAGAKASYDGFAAGIAAGTGSISTNIRTALAALRTLDAAKGLADQRAGERGGSTGRGAIGGGGADPGTSLFPTAGSGGGGGGKEPSIRDLTNQIQAALAG